MAKKSKVKEVIMVGSKTKDAVKEHGDFNVGGDFIEALSDKAHQLIADATARAQANGRKTVRASDL